MFALLRMSSAGSDDPRSATCGLDDELVDVPSVGFDEFIVAVNCARCMLAKRRDEKTRRGHFVKECVARPDNYNFHKGTPGNHIAI